MPFDRLSVRPASFAAALLPRLAAAATGVRDVGALLIAVVWACFLAAPAFAVPAGEELIYEEGPKPAIFSGKSHADHGLKCNDCHTAIFKREKGNAKIAFEDHSGGKYCFACHDGNKSFASKGNCAKCHGNQSPAVAAVPPPAASVMTQDIVKGAAAADAQAAAKPALAAAAPAPEPAAAPKAEARPTGTKACEDCPDYGGWSGWVDAGVGYQTDDSYHFGRYTGLVDKGGVVNAAGDVRYRGEGGRYLDVVVVDLGLDSRSVTVGGGTQGKYGLAIEYDEIPNYREQDGRTPFRDQGGGLLALPPGWVPGPTTGTMPTLGADLVGVSLETQRERLGAKFSLIPAKEWEITGFFRQEKKSGTKDVGATFGYSATSILPANLDYRTDDFGLSLGYLGKRLQYSLAYTGSLFKNEQSAIDWQNPFTYPPGQGYGSMAEAPENQLHRISANLGYQLAEHTRVGAQVSYARLTQDQAFLPYTVNPLIAVPALPAANLDGRVDTTLVKLNVASRPAAGLRLDASYTYSDRDNKSGVNDYYYVIADTALAVDPGTGSPVVRQNLPYSFKQNLLRTKASYLLPKSIELSGGYDYDRMDYTYQQVENSKDNTLWAKLRLQPFDTVEGSLKYSYSSRDASTYVPLSLQNPPIGNPVFPESVNPLMQAFELADRKRNKVALEVAYNPRDTLTLGLGVDYSKDDYPDMVLGLTNADVLTVTPSLTYVFSEALSASAYYTYESLSSEQNGYEWIPVPPLGTSWMLSDSNVTQTFGLGVNWRAIPDKLDLGADVVYSTFTGKIEYANASDLPELGSDLIALGLRGNYRLKERFSLRGSIWYEKYEEDDWAKNAAVDFLPTVLTLGIGPQKLDTVLVFMSVRYEIE